MDIEKIVEAFAKRGLVPPLHFHEGTQIHDNNIDKLILSSENNHRNRPQDPLAVLIGDREIYEETVNRLGICKWPKDVNDLVYVFLKEKTQLGAVRLREADVVEMFIPHLIKFRGSKDIRNIQNVLC